MGKKTINCSREGYSKPDLRCSIMNRIFKSDKGGRPYQWSARKAQLVSKLYKEAGGKFASRKTKQQLSLEKWSEQDWTTKSGNPSLKTGERYLPRKAIRKLTDKQYRRTTAAKRAGMRKGKQFVRQPKDISKITRKYRGADTSRQLYRQKAPTDHMPIRAIHMNDSNSKKLIEEYKNACILIWFYAPWCGHCQDFASVYDEVYEEMKDDNHYAVLYVNIDESPMLTGEYKIEGVPTVYKVKNGRKTMYEGSRTKGDIVMFAMED